MTEEGAAGQVAAVDAHTHHHASRQNGADAPDVATSPATAGNTRIRFSTTMALILAIFGSSVLPVSYAFATTGILAGFLVSLVRLHSSFAMLPTARLSNECLQSLLSN